jgi:hypothetical protein
MLFDRGIGPWMLFDVGRDDDRLDLIQSGDSLEFAPFEKLGNRLGIGDSGISVPNGDGKEFQEPLLSHRTGLRNDLRHLT